MNRRLDIALVGRGLAPSRARARDAILRGCVAVDGRVAERPGAMVHDDARLSVDDPASRYVARSALKLLAALDAYGFSPQGLNALDVGASTGGFTEVLLERGARHVTAVDVGTGQLVSELADDPRVTSLEGLNARDLAPGHLTGPVGAIVADVSFISLKLALPAALDLVSPGAWGVFLVKPQFEVGRERLGKGGIVHDADVAGASVVAIATWLEEIKGWRVEGRLPSPITGGDGNRECLLGATKPPVNRPASPCR